MLRALVKPHYNLLHILLMLIGMGMFMYGVAPKIEAYINPVHELPIGIVA